MVSNSCKLYQQLASIAACNSEVICDTRMSVSGEAKVFGLLWLPG